MGATVVVGMSGGVDSSVAAALLVEQGYRVIGIMLRLWSEEGREQENRCCTPDDMAQARRVAAILGIPFYAVDVRELFRDTVVQNFLDGYRAGITPNPCLVCNRQIRWGHMLEQALKLGADYLATGHYACLDLAKNGKVQLLRAVDGKKDQSYVLSMLNQKQLSRTLFPLGGLTKQVVREMALNYRLPTARRSESQDLCFLGGEDYRTFLTRYVPEAASPGPIYDRDGSRLGEHEGLAFYTIGQRKGLKISNPEPLFVLDKKMSENALIVGPAEQLGQQCLETEGFNWIAEESPAEPFAAEVKIRYRAALAPAEIQPLENGNVRMVFERWQRDITPGQVAAVYLGRVVLGGGRIARVDGRRTTAAPADERAA